MRRFFLAFLLCAVALSVRAQTIDNLPTVGTLGAMSTNASNATLPMALNNLGLGTTSNVQFGTLAIGAGGITNSGAYNKVTLTAPATNSTLTVADGKTLASNSTITLGGTDGKSLTLTNALTVQGNDGTLSFGGSSTTQTFPSTSQTLVGTTAIQPLSNKTLDAVTTINQQAHEASFTSSTSTSFTTISGLDQTFTSGGVYSCNGHMHFTTAPTTSNGVKLQLASDGTSSITTLNFNAIGFNSAAFATSGTGTATALGSTAISSQNAFTDIILNGEIVVNAGGVIHVQFNEVATSGTIAGNARWDCHRAS